jgi:hypothetical protein
MKKLTTCVCAVAFSLAGFSQKNQFNITGNIETTFQYLNEDTLIGADQPDEKGLLNTYMNVFATYGNFKAGLRMESYLPRIQGYPNRFDGTGFGMRYVGYANDFVDVTLGSFYEQFGSGMALRTYEDRALGYDNMLDGVRLIVRPHSGLTLKGVYGLQRLSFQEGRIVHTDGVVRGIDGEIDINSFFDKLRDKKLKVTIGGSFVSKYQKDEDETLVLPENVGLYGGRAKFRYGKFTLNGEYVIKEQDPSVDNGYIYNFGHAALFNFGYSQKGLGILLSAKSVDNMSYRSDRTMLLTDAFINYLPALNKTHAYSLVSSIYPYATQPTGEVAFQAEVLYTMKRGSKLGGKYGTSLNANFSAAYLPIRHTDGIDPLDSTGIAYKGKLFDLSDSLLWMDINFNIYKKFSKKFNIRLSYFNISLNNDVGKVSSDAHGIIQSNIAVAEFLISFNRKHALRVEAQGLFVNKVEQETEPGFFEMVPNDKGNWASLLLEYTISPHWFLSVMDLYNYGNQHSSKRVHYAYVSAGYIRGATRITVGYGRQREGLFCVGGVCRYVPASNGLTLSFTQSF